MTRLVALAEGRSAGQVKTSLQLPQATRLPSDPAGRRSAVPQCGQFVRPVMIARAVWNAQKSPCSDDRGLHFHNLPDLGLEDSTVLIEFP
jgi:hypothetical protein